MLRVRFLSLLLALMCVLGFAAPALAAQVDCDATYCFTPEDFGEEALVGICITQLPDSYTGTVMLGNRVIRPGDILTSQQVEAMTFSPLRTEQDRDAVVTYLPIYENRVAPAATMTLSIRGKEDKAPVAEDMALETYKNLPNQGQLKVSDPEGQTLTYALAREPRRGEVVLNADGTFTYTPKKNKVGIDSFTYTAADPAGHVSREATVTVQILKPTDSRQYTDTVGLDCRFAAEWMRNTGLFVGEKIGEKECFYPEKNVSRGQFLAMMVNALDIPTQELSYDDLPADTPDWLKPYLAAALRSGLTTGLPKTEAGSFASDDPITGAEAAVMLQNALDLSISQETLEAMENEGISQEIPVWAAVSLTAMAENGVALGNTDTVTRGELAMILYQVDQLAPTAPGTAVFRMQQ